MATSRVAYRRSCARAPPEVFGAAGWRIGTVVVRNVRKVAAVTEGRLPAGLPYLRLGQGPPLVMALGGAAEHANPTGAGRRLSLVMAGRFAGHFTVYVTSRKPGLAPGATMADIAADYATAIGDEFGEPVVFHGSSAGGAVGLQLAIGYPHLVRRLVLAAAACRLSPSGRQLLAEVARLVKAGDSRRASAVVAKALAPRLLRHPAGGLAWLVNPFVAGNPADMLITNAAMVAFDAEPELRQVRAPALVMGGSADPYYSEELFRRTAAAIPAGRAVIFPGKGHLYAAASKAAANIALEFLLGE
jgi:pimeloyl-ACP methyl ester carboxylesterase